MQLRFSEHFSYKKIIKAVIPTVLMMVFTSVYGIVDGLFVSNIVGKIAFAGVNLIMPVIMIIGAIGFMLGAGGSALTAKTLGEGNRERANEIFSMIVYFTIIASLVISSLALIFLRKIATALGGNKASAETIENAVLYGKILICFQVAFMLQNVFQSFFVTGEKASSGFIITVVAGVTNIVLDALFVAVFQWGIAGAAFATGISQAVGALIPFIYFSRKNTSLLKLRKTVFEIKSILKASANGSSELLSNISMSIVSILYNFQLLRFAGENGVAAYGVIMYAGFIFCAIFIGYAIGVSPIISYNFGAKNTKELKNLFKKSLIIISVFSLIMLALTEIFAPGLSGIFVGYDERLLNLTARGFRLYGISFLLCGFNIFASAFFTALNDGLISALISFARTLLFQIIFVLLLPELWAIDGVWLAIVFAEICSLVFSAICITAKREKYQYI